MRGSIFWARISIVVGNPDRNLTPVALGCCPVTQSFYIEMALVQGRKITFSRKRFRF
jgi:hypothetical protein